MLDPAIATVLTSTMSVRSSRGSGEKGAPVLEDVSLS